MGRASLSASRSQILRKESGHRMPYRDVASLRGIRQSQSDQLLALVRADSRSPDLTHARASSI
jgi:hypothetical protein